MPNIANFISKCNTKNSGITNILNSLNAISLILPLTHSKGKHQYECIVLQGESILL